MKRLRLASPEEVESIKAESDLDPTCLVVALDIQGGTALAVIRTVCEVDPVFYPKDFSDRMKLIFIRDVETFLSAKGVGSYYYNLPADDTIYHETMKHYGAEQVSKVPELRFKVNL